MDLHINIELEAGLLLVTAGGTVAFDAALRLLKQVFNTAVEKQVNAILVNGLALDGKLSTLERYRLGIEVAAYLKERKMNLRIAFVGTPPTLDGFGVRVAQNRGATVNMFSSQQGALNWLTNG
jgi:hypothetical protein